MLLKRKALGTRLNLSFNLFFKMLLFFGQVSASCSYKIALISIIGKFIPSISVNKVCPVIRMTDN